MLIVPDSTKLGDGKLSPHEQLKKSFEETDSALMQYRLDDHEDLKNAEKRLGKPMQHQELIRRIERCNPRVWAEATINHDTGMNFYTNRKGVKTCLGAAFEKGWLPEFSIVFVDAADLPVKEKRGWRTVVVRLLKQRIITWEQVLNVFGDALGHNSKRWAMETQQYRA